MGIGKRPRATPPDLFTDPLLIDLDLPVKWTALGLRMHADDEGRENANTTLLWSSIWPLSTTVTPDDLTLHLLLLEEVGEIVLYTAGGQTYYQETFWPAIDRGTASRLPPPPESLATGLARDSRTARDLAREGFAAGGERREGGEAPGEGRSRVSREVPRSPFCPDHPEGTFEKCGPCGTARVRHDADKALLRKQAEEEATS